MVAKLAEKDVENDAIKLSLKNQIVTVVYMLQKWNTVGKYLKKSVQNETFKSS